MINGFEASSGMYITTYLYPMLNAREMTASRLQKATVPLWMYIFRYCARYVCLYTCVLVDQTEEELKGPGLTSPSDVKKEGEGRERMRER